jgi:hypothetical protein
MPCKSTFCRAFLFLGDIIGDVLKFQIMHQWLKIEFNDLEAVKSFVSSINEISLSRKSDKYFKVFTYKEKKFKYLIFYIAHEGSEIIESLKASYALKEALPPARNLLTRVAGFRDDKDWMFEKK